jgi:hypothetical protein
MMVPIAPAQDVGPATEAKFLLLNGLETATATPPFSISQSREKTGSPIEVD